MVHMLVIRILYTTNTVPGSILGASPMLDDITSFSVSRVQIDDRQVTQWSVKIAVKIEAEEAIISRTSIFVHIRITVSQIVSKSPRKSTGAKETRTSDF
jgi:hypothetical protein